MLSPWSPVWNAVAAAGVGCFFLGLSLILLSRGKTALVAGSLVALGGLLVCYSLSGFGGGKAAAAQYFGCLSVVLVVAQLSFWTVVVRESTGSAREQRRND